jgi:hypothetical protein
MDDAAYFDARLRQSGHGLVADPSLGVVNKQIHMRPVPRSPYQRLDQRPLLEVRNGGSHAA